MAVEVMIRLFKQIIENARGMETCASAEFQ